MSLRMRKPKASFKAPTFNKGSNSSLTRQGGFYKAGNSKGYAFEEGYKLYIFSDSQGGVFIRR